MKIKKEDLKQYCISKAKGLNERITSKDTTYNSRTYYMVYKDALCQLVYDFEVIKSISDENYHLELG